MVCLCYILKGVQMYRKLKLRISRFLVILIIFGLVSYSKRSEDPSNSEIKEAELTIITTKSVSNTPQKWAENGQFSHVVGVAGLVSQFTNNYKFINYGQKFPSN